MIKHLFKMVWNRKRWNVLILIEIFLSFLVLFVVAIAGLTLFNYQRHPVGFDYSDVWLLTRSTPDGAMNEENAENTFSLYRQLDAFLKNQNEINTFGNINTPPYMGSNWSTGITLDRGVINTNLTLASIGVLDALDLKISSGRWFNEGDMQEKTVIPLVVNQRLAKALFPNEVALGQRVIDKDDDESTEYEIIGIIDHFRKEGELKKPRNFGFVPLVFEKDMWLPRYSLLEMAPSANQALEEKVIKGLEGIAPEWSFKIEPYHQRRSSYMMAQTRNLKIMGLVAFFLLLMVAMGLIGVLWQHVTRRTVELGVRRAKGATRRKIYSQIIGEFLIIATLALGLGLVFVIQIPFFGWFQHASTSVLVSSFLVAGLSIYLLTIVASLYPGWMATKIMPAEALHYE